MTLGPPAVDGVAFAMAATPWHLDSPTIWRSDAPVTYCCGRDESDVGRSEVLPDDSWTDSSATNGLADRRCSDVADADDGSVDAEWAYFKQMKLFMKEKKTYLRFHKMNIHSG